MIRPTPFLAGIALLLGAHSLSAATLVSDTFEVSDHPTGDRTVVAGGGNGIQFFTRNATGGSYSVNIGDDSGSGKLGSKALQLSDSGGNNQIIGMLPQTITLGSPGDFIQLAFRFRYTNTASAASYDAGFRFGLYGSNGTVVPSDGQGASLTPHPSDNDLGYYVQTGVQVSPSKTNTLWRENGKSFPILAGASGGDRTNLATNILGAGFSSDAVHTASLTLTRKADMSLELSLIYDGGPAITSSDAAPYSQFDEIAFSNAVTTPSVNFNLDDIVIMTNLVPEPGCGSFLAIGAGGLISLLRRRSSMSEH